MTKKGHTMTGILTSIASVMVGVSMLLSSAGCAPTQPPTKPKAIPQVLWDVLWDKDGFKEANRDEHVNTTDGLTMNRYLFRISNQYRLKCEASEKGAGSGLQTAACVGKLPIPGSRDYIPLSPISSTKLPLKYGALVLPIDGESGFATGSDPSNDGFVWSLPLKVLPVGYKIFLPKVDDKEFEEYYGKKYGYLNRSLVCVVPSPRSVGCLRSDNHGFLVNDYGTYMF